MSSTIIELIRAKQNTLGQAKKEEEAQKEYERKQLLERFAHLQQILDEVAEMPSRSFCYGSTQIIPMKKHWRTWGNIQVQFWRDSGSEGLSITAVAGSDPKQAFAVRLRKTSSRRLMSLEEARDCLIERIAEYLLPDGA